MSEETNTETVEAATIRRYCPICAGFVYWKDSLTLVPELAGYECEECYFFEFT